MRQPGRHQGKTRFRTARRTLVTLGTVAAASAALLVPADAVTTVSGGDAGTNPPVIRGSSTTITSDQGALMYYRSGSAATVANTAYAAQSTTLLKVSARRCSGDVPPITPPPASAPNGGGNNSPRQIITVTAPGGAVIATEVSPVRDLSLFGSAAPIIAAPSATNYRGDSASATAYHGMSFPLNLAGRPSGTYTVTTSTYNQTKSDITGSGASQGPCVVGVPNPATGGKTVIPGPVTSSTTFIYRPWQNTFVDAFSAGKVFANVTPGEYQFTLGTAADTSPIWTDDDNTQKFYAFPSTEAFVLPTSPECLDDPASCLPALATPCDPDAGCVPRIMTISHTDGQPKLQGTFDLQTKAFMAQANINGKQRTLASTGTANDALIASLLLKLKNAAAAKGINLDTLLNTKVRVVSGQNQLELSLLQALQINPSSAKGVQIVSDTTIQAGLILDLYYALPATSCTTKAATNASVPARFVPTSGSGIKVDKSDLLPAVPSVGPLGAITSGPLFHITGKFGPGQLVNTASALLGLDTAADEPNGYPVWVEPFLSAGHVNSPSTMDFLGTATWSASETNLSNPITGPLCLIQDLMIGTGVALYNNPLPVGFGTLLDPLYKPSPAAEKLLNQIDTTVQSVVDQAATNPTVAALLDQILAALPV
jgi:hypothetical protein